MGRKKKMKTGEKFDIRLRIDSDDHELIALEADLDDRSVASFIRTIVMKEVHRRRAERGEK
jgi:uncharacterized protein (DUF1778 family)